VAASQALWSYPFDHQEFMQGFQRMLISFWPLFLVIAGSLVLRNGFTGNPKEFQKKRPTCRVAAHLKKYIAFPIRAFGSGTPARQGHR
jgi:surface polysaccharide O-acyltransferase-like enzyme